MFGWLFNLGKDDEDKSLIEISDAGSTHDVIEIPTSAVKEIEKKLKRAGIKKENIDKVRGLLAQQREINTRSPKELRYMVDRIIDELELDEASEADEQDDWNEASAQGAEQYWNRDSTRRNYEDAADDHDSPRYDIYKDEGAIQRAAAEEVRRMIEGK
ncbi:MAG: hypothetical protein F6J97_00960 [Leptolyngbya sp. SIO4C1]|nr:hypothetical protein [Leptolyngbya sp. SIO4C1]